MHGRTDAGAGISKQEIQDPSSVFLQQKAKHFSKSSAATKTPQSNRGNAGGYVSGQCQLPKSPVSKSSPQKKTKRGYRFFLPSDERSRESSSVFSLMLEITPGNGYRYLGPRKRIRISQASYDVATDTGGVVAELFFFLSSKVFKRQPELTRTNYSVSAVSTQNHPIEKKISGEAS
jgi:hypothetical protein